MTLKRLFPFILSTILWAIYVGLAQGAIIALSIAIGTIGVSYIQSIMATDKAAPEFANKRFKTFVLVWVLVMCAQVFFYFYAKALSPS